MEDELGPDGRIKNLHERDVPIERPFRELLEAHLGARPDVRMGGFFFQGRRFTNRTRSPIRSRWTFKDSLRRAVEESGFTRIKVDWRVLRRSCGCRWIQHGGPQFNELKLTFWMGHTADVSRKWYQAIAGSYDPAVETGIGIDLGGKLTEDQKYTTTVELRPKGAKKTDETRELRPKMKPAETPEERERREAARRAMERARKRGRA